MQAPEPAIRMLAVQQIFTCLVLLPHSCWLLRKEVAHSVQWANLGLAVAAAELIQALAVWLAVPVLEQPAARKGQLQPVRDSGRDWAGQRRLDRLL